MPKYKGKQLKVTWTPDGGGSPIDLSGSSREFEYSGKGNKIDVTTRESDGKESLVDDAEYTGKLNGLDTTGTPDWEEDLEIGDAGTLTWYPEGDAVGKRKRSAPANVASVDFKSPHNNAATWELGFDFTAKPTKTVVPTP